MLHTSVAVALANVFKEKTGSEWGSLKPGDHALPGKHWLQQQASPDLLAKWEYYVSDGVDGKRTGWYPYEPAASAEVEELYAQHVANGRESRTAARLVSSGHFTYHVDLTKMTQQNTRTKKVRTIHRAVGNLESDVALTKTMTKAMKAASRKMSKKRTMKGASMKPAVKSMKMARSTTVMKAVKSSSIGSRSQVLKGQKLKTKGGMRASDLIKNKDGKVVSKKLHLNGKQKYELNLAKWVNACSKARKELGLIGFVAVKKGTPFYNLAKELMSSCAEPAL